MKWLTIFLFCITAIAQTHITAGNINGTYYVNQYPGADIGEKINYVYANLCQSTGCAVIVPPSPTGNYTFSTPIVAATASKPLVIKCDGSSSTGPTVLTYTRTTGIAVTLATGLGSGISGCNIQGQGPVNSSVGLSISNTGIGIQTQSVIEKTGISSFGTCLQFGNNAYLISFRDNSFSSCTTVLDYPSTITGSGEDIIFYGGLFQGIVGSFSTTCMNIARNAETISFFGVSFDSCGITLAAAGINALFAGGNMENLGNPGAPGALDFLTMTAACTQCSVTLSGVNIIDDFNSGRAHLITNGANGGHLTTVGGKFSFGGTAAGFVNGAAGSITSVINPFFNIRPTNIITGSGAQLDTTTGTITTNEPVVMNGTSWTAGVGDPSGNCIGGSGIYINSTPVDPSHVLAVCAGNTYYYVTVP